MTRLIVLFIAALFVIGWATLAHSRPRSSWLDDAWSPETIAQTGGPAITLSADGSITIILPVATLRAARASGLTTKQAVSAFLERYGQHCSDVLDLDQPHTGLSVTLFLERPVWPGAFMTGEDSETFSIDYVPLRRARCVTPRQDGPTS